MEVIKRELSPDEQERRLGPYDEIPVRKIMLWGTDRENNPCLILLYGKQEIEFKKVSTRYSYEYVEEYVLEKNAKYKSYAIFRGINGHLPSIPNVHYEEMDNILCTKKGYKEASPYWYNVSDDIYAYRYIKRFKINEKYKIKEFYSTDDKIEFDCYKKHTYKEYVSYLKSNNIKFNDCEVVEDLGSLFGFNENSKYYNYVLDMFTKERLYSRKKALSQFIKTNPSFEDYEKLLNVASVELACGIFQELTITKNPILLEKAKEINASKDLWATEEGYHKGLKRILKQYISVFDEKMIKKQKEDIYNSLPDMDFHIKKLEMYGQVMTGDALEEYLSNTSYFNIYNIGWVFGNQKLFDKNKYTDGRNFKNIAFKNTIQTAKAYGMADAIGKIAYCLDAPRTTYYLKGSKEGKAYDYFVRYIRRTIDEYKQNDEEKFVQAAREMLVSYTPKDGLLWYDFENYYNQNYFFNRYFSQKIKNGIRDKEDVWDRHIDDVIYIAKNAKSNIVGKFCYITIKKAYDNHKFDNYDLKELISLTQIPYTKTAELFEHIVLPRIQTLDTFDGEIMLLLMDTVLDKIKYAAEDYFVRTNGKFSPENTVNMFALNSFEKWLIIIKKNIHDFTPTEYISFVKNFLMKNEYFINSGRELPDNVKDFLKDSITSLNNATIEEKQDLLQYIVSLLLENTVLTDFMTEFVEDILFSMPYDELKQLLQNVEFKNVAMKERTHNTITLLKAVKEDVVPKDTVIVSILDTGSPKVVKVLTEVIEKLKSKLSITTLLLISECSVYALNETAKSVFENMDIENREKLHMILIDSPVEKVHKYALEKLDEWYGNKTPKQFIYRMLEHPCIAVKSFLSEKMDKAFSNLKDVQPDLYIYYVKTLLYLPNKVSKSKDYVYNTIPTFLKYYPDRKKELEDILLDIGSTNVKFNSEKALVTFAKIQREVCNL